MNSYNILFFCDIDKYLIKQIIKLDMNGNICNNTNVIIELEIQSKMPLGYEKLKLIIYIKNII